MTDTPRTDSDSREIDSGGGYYWIVDADTSRTLERELAAMTARAEKAEAAQDALFRVNVTATAQYDQWLSESKARGLKAEAERDEARAELARLTTEPVQEPVEWQNWRQCAKGQRTTQFCKQVQAAVTAEREACAQMVDHILKEGGGTYGEAIRARGEK
jgi:hypothetical protein